MKNFFKKLKIKIEEYGYRRAQFIMKNGGYGI
jgi:hypothetical protein